MIMLYVVPCLCLFIGYMIWGDNMGPIDDKCDLDYNYEVDN